VLFGLAAVLRLAWVGVSWHQHGTSPRYPDEALHWQLATNLVERGALVSDDGLYAARMPLYPLFLACFAGLGECGIIAARLAQALLGALTCIAAGMLAGRLWGERAALPAFLLAALEPFSIYMADLLLSETVFTLLLVLFVDRGRQLMVDPRGLRNALVFAALGAALVLARPSAFALLPVIWLLVAGMAADRRTATQRVIMAPFVLVLALLPWALRNMHILRDFAWLSTNGGVTLYDAQGPQANGSSDQSFLERMPELAPLGEVERDRRLRQRAVAQMRADPGRVAELAAIKLARTWNPFPNVAELRGGPAAWAGGLYSLGLYILAGLALVRAARPATLSRATLLLAPCVYFALLHAVYIGSVRYRLPVMPLLATLSACVFVPPGRSAARD
jgi:4-amino-4-deoxy-L-arabinose transferase-like glycosyltransferase